jgi:hypothetical protein
LSGRFDDMAKHHHLYLNYTLAAPSSPAFKKKLPIPQSPWWQGGRWEMGDKAWAACMGVAGEVVARIQPGVTALVARLRLAGGAQAMGWAHDVVAAWRK